MKPSKGIFTSIVLAVVAVFSSLNPCAASIVLPAASDSQAAIRSATANDKVYLSYAPSYSDDDSQQNMYHYSHRSHGSHGSHGSHASHYSSTY